MKKFSRIIALILCVMMLLSMLPSGVFAAENEAKAAPVVLGAEEIDPSIPIFENPQYSFAERAADLVGRMTLQQKASEITSQSAPAISASQLSGGALNVPATKGISGYTWWSETLHGTRSGVNYPQNTTVASTWNPDLYYQESTNIGQEIRERNNTNLNFYSPTINMHRDPRWGRNEESYSEDVLLTATMGTAWVQGLEGKDREGNVLDPDGYLMAHSTIKHYVANNNEGANSSDTTGRLRAGAISSVRMLREYYALPYGEVIRNADVSSVMTAYSYYGVEKGKFDPSSYSSYLMDTLLRQIYGLSGYITSDCDSVNSMQNLHYINYYTGKEITAPEAMAGALAHGEDLECNGGHSSSGSGTSGFHTSYGAQMNAMLGQETDKGIFTENSVDISLHRLMTARIQTGDLDGNIKIKQDASARSGNATELKNQRRELVEQINREGIVMLQNKDSILPLDLSEDGINNIAIVGSWQTNGSTGLYAQASGNQQNIQAGIQAAFNKVKSGINYTLVTSNNLSDANKAAIAAADVAIVVTGTTSSYSQEDRDRTTTALPDNQETLINNVAACNPNTIVIMETCGPMRVNRFQNNVKAILWSSFGGQWKNGFGDIMAGYCPSGKVTDTWYNEVNDTGASDIPPVTDYDLLPSEGKNGRTYMYYNGESAPSYPFGYGLSYTTFEYSDLIIDKTAYDANDTIKVSFDVKNTGAVAGKETTQLYVAQPDAPEELKRPIRRLEGFKKIDLEPGETKTVSMEVKIEDLAFYNDADDCFKVDTGAYQIQVGTNSAEANLTADFTVSGELTEVPAVVTMKANQAGDAKNGIEQRLIFDKNKEVNPQLTVSMNNEKLYGYIIAQQHSNIKSKESCALPEGMEVVYTSNRPNVVKVEGDKITTVGPGVATLTATVTYNGVTSTGDAIIYVMTTTDIDDILVDGEPLEKFNPKTYSYSMKLENKKHIPVVEAVSSNPDLEITVTQAAELPGSAIIVAKDNASNVSSTYEIKFKVPAPKAGGYFLADTVEAGKQYVIVSNGYALTNEVAQVSTAYGGTSLGSTPVEVENDAIISDVSPEMIWDFAAGTSSSNNGYATGYFLTNGDSKFLSRNGPTNENPAPLNTQTYDESNVASKPQYCYWVVKDLDDAGNKALFVTGTGEWSFALRGAAAGFDAPGSSNANTVAAANPVQLYEVVPAPALPDIDFTTEDDSSKYEIIGQTSSKVEEGVGLALVTTASGIENAKNQLSGSAATTPVDLVAVPVAGDWTATLEVDFSKNGARNGYYQFFGFYASMGEDYQNMVGIRGGDGAMQNFTCLDGAIVSDSSDLNSTPGFASEETYWLRIVKEGTTYTCQRSSNGEDFTDMFTYTDTDVEADQILIDAYTGQTTGYKFTLKSLTFEGGSAGPIERAAVASISVDGNDISFDPAVKVYNLEAAKGGKAPVIAAVAGNKSTEITIDQLDAPVGTAYVKATANGKTLTYTLVFNYAPQNDYLADGDYDASLWTILNKDETAFSVEAGKGLVLPTQRNDVYTNGTGWKNCFTMPAMGNWDVVTKVVFPVRPDTNYQQAEVLFWQDEDNYIRLNCQNTGSNLVIEPGKEVDGSFTAGTTANVQAAADNTLTLYFRFRKDGDTLTGYYSQDGSTYKEAYSATGVDAYVDPKLALTSTINADGDIIDTYYEYVYVAAREGLQPEFVAMLDWAAQNAADTLAAAIPAEADGDIAIPAAPHGYAVNVESSDPSVIAADGTVTPAAADKDVVLTFTVSEGSASASASATVKVAGTGEAEDVEVVIDDPTIPIYENPQYTFAERAADLVARMTVQQKGTQIVSTASAIPAANLGGGALNVPATKNIDSYEWWSEALHGYSRGNTSGAVSYPQNLTVASTWNPELYNREAVEIGNEIREKTSKNSQTGNAKNLNFYSPTVNMHRDPRWGRNEESFSEDVYLTGKMASEFVKGVEGRDADGNLLDPDGYRKAMCTVKHYTANNSERNRLSGGAVSDVRAIREYYTAPYREVIQQAHVTSVMTAYSTLNGEPTSYSSYLMDTLLRQTFGLDGHITSDCDSAATQNRHAYVNPYTGDTMTDLEALAGALAHGEDLECNGGYSGFGTYATKMTKMVDAAPMTDKGTFTENALDVALHHLMTDRISTGEFDEGLAYTAAAQARIDNGESGRTEERLSIIDAIDNEGVVMLKNNGVLPLAIPAEGEYNVAIVGAWQTNTYLGLYSAGSATVNIQAGIMNAIRSVNENVSFTTIASDSLSDENKAAIAAADAVIVVTGTNSNYSKEDGDRTTIALPNGQADLISTVGKLNAKTIAVMETCGEMQVNTFENDVAAILWSSYQGLRKVGFGNVIAGLVNPSGKITDTWYTVVSDAGESDITDIYDYNLYATNGSSGRTYMYYTGKVQYPFGYGLSYTTFEYSNLSIDKTAYDANDTVKVSFDVKNTGSVAGKETTQLYVAQPEAPAELLRPAKRLEGFDKIELQPGETKTVTMEVEIPELAYFNEEAQRYEVDTGLYQIQVGGNSVLAADLTADFTVSGEMDVYPVLLTVKANQVGDTEAGIEERIIFDKGAMVNPQLTVCMNDESLWGYVIAHQKSPIDQVVSTELPEGMTFEYHSNRPSVAKVTKDGIKCVNAGVATITVIGKLDGVEVTADFVVYVQATSFLDGITLDGKPLEGFNREKFAYEMNAADFDGIPEVGYISNTEGLEVTVEQFSGNPGVAVITSVEVESGTTTVYRLGFGSAPVTTDFSEGWEAAEAKGWKVVGGNENASFGENGLTIIGEDGMAANLYSEPAFGEWVVQTKVDLAEALNANNQRVGLIVKDTDNSYVLLVYERMTSSSWWSTSTNYYVTAYAMQDGTLNQIARSGNIREQTELELRIIKNGINFTFAYAVGGVWTEMNGTAKVAMADPKVGPFCGNVAGVTATFDGINVCTISELYPRAASIKINGVTFSEFDPEVFVYNFEAVGDAAPVFEATADEGVQIAIEQIESPIGVVKVTAYNDVNKAEYFFYYDRGPVSDYMADGDISDVWTIERENADTYSIEQGKGLILPTQSGDIHGTGGAWENCFTAPAQGNWQAVAKIVYPNIPTANYQQAMFLVWQDENNYLRMNAQTSNLNMEPGVETNGSFNGNLGSGQAIPSEDGTVTLYFMIEKDGTSYTVGYSQDGINFKRLNTVKNVNFANPRIGLFATQNSSSAQMNMYYEYVAVTWLNGVQQMTYEQMTEWAAQNVADYVAADVPAEATEDIVFSAVPHGYELTVASSDPSVIAPDGTVTPTAVDKNVTLTITASDANSTASATVTVKVPGNGPVESPFEDVDPDAYYFDAVVWAAENGITNGFEPGLFAPNNDVTRAQIVTMLWRAAGCPIVETAAGFKDVKADAYYYDAVAWAVAEGITNGVGKNMFAPNDICTRGQIVTFLWRYMGKPAAETAAEFSDVPAGEYYADAVAWAVEAKIAEGYPEGIFKPIADCTRAQAVTFIQRALAD